jgi:hypothetical protein
MTWTVGPLGPLTEPESELCSGGKLIVVVAKLRAPGIRRVSETPERRPDERGADPPAPF